MTALEQLIKEVREARHLNEKGNSILSEKADDYTKKLFPCTPPCDAYGVCENCCEKTVFRVGYKFGLMSQNKIELLLKIIERQNEAIRVHSTCDDCVDEIEAEIETLIKEES